MRRIAAATVCSLLCCTAAYAGVVIVMETGDTSPKGEVTAEIDTIYAEDGMLRMDPHPTRSAKDMSMIFRDDTLFVVDHRKKAVQRIDREGIEDLSAQMNDAMAHMEAEMAKLPPEQREMMEKMMKGKMSRGMPGVGEELPERRVEVGASETVAGYECTVHTVYAGDEIVSEVCATDAGDVPAAQEALEAFQAMAAFSQELIETARQGPLAGVIGNPYQNLDEVDGFPIRVRTYSDGRLSSVSTLQSIDERDLEDGTFAVPENYKVDDLADQLTKKGR